MRTAALFATVALMSMPSAFAAPTPRPEPEPIVVLPEDSPYHGTAIPLGRRAVASDLTREDGTVDLNKAHVRSAGFPPIIAEDVCATKLTLEFAGKIHSCNSLAPAQSSLAVSPTSAPTWARRTSSRPSWSTLRCCPARPRFPPNRHGTRRMCRCRPPPSNGDETRSLASRGFAFTAYPRARLPHRRRTSLSRIVALWNVAPCPTPRWSRIRNGPDRPRRATRPRRGASV